MENPLVSIIVITYNSSKYVLETLESAYNQTYQNIELIVSDDCSTDNTVEICRNWIDEHQSRFIRAELITVEKNTGIPANCNRGLKVSNGEWVKYIAGDDVLINSCIYSNISFIQKNIHIKFLFSTVNFISETSSIIRPPEWHFINDSFFNAEAIQQNKELINNGNFLLAPTAFINREVLIKLNGFDPRIPMQEDYALWMKATSAGHKLFYNPIETVNYRINSTSITNNGSLSYKKSQYLNFLYYRSPKILSQGYRNWYFLFINYYSNAQKNRLFKLLKLTSTKYLKNKLLPK